MTLGVWGHWRVLCGYRSMLRVLWGLLVLVLVRQRLALLVLWLWLLVCEGVNGQRGRVGGHRRVTGHVGPSVIR